MLNVRASNVIDVGYAGVIGADRIWHGQSPYGNFPVEDDRPKCGPADASGEVRDRIQTNGRCENANPRGDTYGPVSYIAYLPGYLVFGWSGKWDTLPAAHATAILWDLLALLGLALVGRRLGGAATRRHARVRLGGVAVHAVRLELEHERPDPAGAADLGLLLRELACGARRASSRSRSWVKFAPLLLVPLWSGYPEHAGAARPRSSSSSASRSRRALAFSVLLLEPSPLARGARLLGPHDRLAGRPRVAVLALGLAAVPREGMPDLHLVQRVLQVLLVVGRAGAVALAAAAARRCSSRRSRPRC